MESDRKIHSEKDSENEDLLDRRIFLLNEEQWRSFNEILNRPPQENPRLKKLLTEPGLFD